MTGRPKKVYTKLYRDVYVGNEIQARILVGTILLLCPECGTWEVGEYGTKKCGKTRVQYYQCKNPHCFWRENHSSGKQFKLSTSALFKNEICLKLKDLYSDLFNGAKNKTVAKKYGMSKANITKLRQVFEESLDDQFGLENLVDIPQLDTAIAIDETFFKIEGTPIYVIIATGYTTKKTLGIRVSTSRNENDIRLVFDEAEKNTKNLISTITADAWGATIKMAKNLMRKITLIIHKHKKPYDKVVIKQIDYEDTERVITDTGVKTDIFKRRSVREYYYRVRRESIIPKKSKGRGRPKGVKNGQGKKKPKRKNKKRGRKGLFTVFTKGTRGYVKVDPYRKTLKLARGCLASVAWGLNRTFELFARMSIQNNLAENINSVIRTILSLRGPKTIESMSSRLRTTLIVRNKPEIIYEVEIKRGVRSKFLIDNLKVTDFRDMEQRMWKMNGIEKKNDLIIVHP